MEGPGAQRLAFNTIYRLWDGGMHFGGVIDAGCADGQYSVLLAEHGPGRNSVILNIDAQDDYRDSLEAIQGALGGHYRICALAEKDGGTVELTRGSHPYWSSLRPAGDPYWRSIHELHESAPVKVPRRSIDALVAETRLPGPYFIKMDIQGAEAAALRGAKRTLRNTEAVVIEVLMEDFSEIHDVLTRQDLFLFDVTQLSYTKVDSLYSFYAVYLAGRRRELLRYTLFDTDMNQEMVRRHDERRQKIREELAAALQRFREGRWPSLKD